MIWEDCWPVKYNGVSAGKKQPYKQTNNKKNPKINKQKNLRTPKEHIL